MSNDADVVVSNVDVTDASQTTQSASTSSLHTPAPTLTEAQTVILIDALEEVSRDGHDYPTFAAALHPVVRKYNVNHESHITPQTVTDVIADAKARMRVIRVQHNKHNKKLLEYNDNIATETAPFRNARTRYNLSQIKNIIALHVKPTQPPAEPLDADYARAVVAKKVISERIDARRKARKRIQRANQPQSTLTVASSADDQKSEEKADPAVDTAILNGRTLTKQIRGNLRNMSREGLSDVSANVAESKQQIDKLLATITEVKANSDKQTALAERYVQLVEESVEILKNNIQVNNDTAEPNQPKRRRRV
jgi:hypothetical protein